MDHLVVLRDRSIRCFQERPDVVEQSDSEGPSGGALELGWTRGRGHNRLLLAPRSDLTQCLKAALFSRKYTQWKPS